MVTREPILITEETANQRLDNFLYNLFNKQVARSHIYSLIRTGQVRINKGRIKPNYYLKIDDLVRIPPIKFDLKPTPKQNLNKKSLEFWQSKINKSIIFENTNLLIVNKPANLAVHGGSKVSIGLIEVLRSIRPNEHFLELVHRLDRDTSGCIMIAKKRSYLKKLQELLKVRKINKTYSVLVKGYFEQKKVVELPLKKIIKNSKEHFVKVSNDGNFSKTIFKPEKQFCNRLSKHVITKGKNYQKNLEHLDPSTTTAFALNSGDMVNEQQIKSSLIIAMPITGRTHQIRVHLSSIGFPIANDDKYGDREYNVSIKKLGLNRMFLHAKNLNFICPKTNDTINVNAEYDTELINFLSKLEKVRERN